MRVTTIGGDEAKELTKILQIHQTPKEVSVYLSSNSARYGIVGASHAVESHQLQGATVATTRIWLVDTSNGDPICRFRSSELQWELPGR